MDDKIKIWMLEKKCELLEKKDANRQLTATEIAYINGKLNMIAEVMVKLESTEVCQDTGVQPRGGE